MGTTPKRACAKGIGADRMWMTVRTTPKWSAETLVQAPHMWNQPSLTWTRPATTPKWVCRTLFGPARNWTPNRTTPKRSAEKWDRSAAGRMPPGTTPKWVGQGWMALSEKFHSLVPEQVEHCFGPAQVVCGCTGPWQKARGSTAGGSRKGQGLGSTGQK